MYSNKYLTLGTIDNIRNSIFSLNRISDKYRVSYKVCSSDSQDNPLLNNLHPDLADPFPLVGDIRAYSVPGPAI